MPYSIEKYEKIEISSLGIITEAKLHLFHIKINEHSTMIKEFIQHLADTSWIDKMGATDREAYEANAIKSIQKIVNDILTPELNVSPDKAVVISQSGQYIVSYAAQKGLNNKLDHKILPLAEIFKDRILGNSGFDFHTETPTAVIVFGESKYTSKSTPVNTALEQVQEFIKEKKDAGEWIHLKNIISDEAKAIYKEKKSYAVAFTLNCKDIDAKLKSFLSKDILEPFKNHDELFFIGIEL